MPGKKKILFIKNLYQNPKFITNDIEILKKEYEVKLLNFNNRKNFLIIFSLLFQGLYLLFSIWKYDLVYIWFADYLSILPVFFSKLAGKKCIICAGGYEATYIPEINMGVYTYDTFSRSVRANCVKYSLKNCTAIYPVDETLIENTNTYIYSDTPGKPPLKDGIKNFIPGLKTDFNTLYLGYDHEIFIKPENILKENSVLSAGLIINSDEFRRKGFDLLISAAKEMPEIKFVLIGLNDEYLEKIKKIKSDNVTLLGIVPYKKLIEEYSKAKVYAQFSMFEGMPSSICEAMLCECIPVGSNVNGIPKIICDFGIIINERKPEHVIEAIKKAFSLNNNYGLNAREHIIKQFNLTRREYELLNRLKIILK